MLIDFAQLVLQGQFRGAYFLLLCWCFSSDWTVLWLFCFLFSPLHISDHQTILHTRQRQPEEIKQMTNCKLEFNFLFFARTVQTNTALCGKVTFRKPDKRFCHPLQPQLQSSTCDKWQGFFLDSCWGMSAFYCVCGTNGLDLPVAWQKERHRDGEDMLQMGWGQESKLVLFHWAAFCTCRIVLIQSHCRNKMYEFLFSF